MMNNSGPFKRHEEDEDKEEYNYKEEQKALREAGFDAYNCDYVDEFPSW